MVSDTLKLFMLSIQRNVNFSYQQVKYSESFISQCEQCQNTKEPCICMMSLNRGWPLLTCSRPFCSQLQLKVKSIQPHYYVANPVRPNQNSHPRLLPQQQAQGCATTWGDPLSTQHSWQPMSCQHILCGLPGLQQSMAKLCSALKVNMKVFPR